MRHAPASLVLGRHAERACYFVIAVLALVATRAARADDAKPAAAKAEPAKVSYFRDVRPVLQEHCQGCHQPAKRSGEYVMTPFAALLKGGESGDAAIVPGKPEESNLVAQITPSKKGKAEMPKDKEPLKQADIELIRQWIAEGAIDDTPASAAVTFDAAHPPVYHAPPVLSSLDYSPDGKLLAVSGYHEVLLWKADGSAARGPAGRAVGADRNRWRFRPTATRWPWPAARPRGWAKFRSGTSSRKLLLSVPMTYDTLYGVSWSPDGTKIAFGCADNTVRAIDAKTGQQVLFQGAHNDWVLGTAFSTDASHLVIRQPRSLDEADRSRHAAVRRQYHQHHARRTQRGLGVRRSASEEGRIGGGRRRRRAQDLSDVSPGRQARQIGDDFNLVRDVRCDAGPDLRGRVQSRRQPVRRRIQQPDGTGEIRVYEAGQRQADEQVSRRPGPDFRRSLQSATASKWPRPVSAAKWC